MGGASLPPGGSVAKPRVLNDINDVRSRGDRAAARRWIAKQDGRSPRGLWCRKVTDISQGLWLYCRGRRPRRPALLRRKRRQCLIHLIISFSAFYNGLLFFGLSRAPTPTGLCHKVTDTSQNCTHAPSVDSVDSSLPDGALKTIPQSLRDSSHSTCGADRHSQRRQTPICTIYNI